MKNFWNLIIKTVFILVVLAWFIPLFGKSMWTQTIITGIILSILAYVVADLWVLPNFGNLAAVITEFVMAALVIWLMMKALPQFVLSGKGVLMIALIIGLGEWLFHGYLKSTSAKKAGTP